MEKSCFFVRFDVLYTVQGTVAIVITGMQKDKCCSLIVCENDRARVFIDCLSKSLGSGGGGGGRYNCDECGKLFRHPGSLQHHRHIHRGTHRCPSCGKVRVINCGVDPDPLVTRTDPDPADPDPSIKQK